MSWSGREKLKNNNRKKYKNTVNLDQLHVFFYFWAIFFVFFNFRKLFKVYKMVYKVFFKFVKLDPDPHLKSSRIRIEKKSWIRILEINADS